MKEEAHSTRSTAPRHNPLQFIALFFASLSLAGSVSAKEAEDAKLAAGQKAILTSPCGIATHGKVRRASERNPLRQGRELRPQPCKEGARAKEGGEWCK